MTVALSQMREELHTGGVQRKRDVLRSFVDRIEAERERARLWYTFPLLQQRVFYSMPPGEYLLKGPVVLRRDRTDPVESSSVISCKCGIGQSQVAEARSLGRVGAEGLTREATNRSPPVTH
jgi:hypothetical protein